MVCIISQQQFRLSSWGIVGTGDSKLSCIGGCQMEDAAMGNLIAQLITLLGSLGFFFLTFRALKQLEK